MSFCSPLSEKVHIRYYSGISQILFITRRSRGAEHLSLYTHNCGVDTSINHFTTLIGKPIKVVLPNVRVFFILYGLLVAFKNRRTD